jgi:hypothetical protein
MVQDFVNYAKFRGAGNGEAAISDLRLHRVLHEYNRQAMGATGFTAHNLAALSLTFLILAYAAKLKTSRQFWWAVAGVVAFYAAAIFWNVTMRQHSVIHVHFLPRHYFALYLGFLFVALPISRDLVLRARAAIAR